MREQIGSDVNIPTFERKTLENIPGVDPRTVSTLESLPQSRDTITESINGLVDDTNEIEVQPILTYGPATDPVDPILTATRQLVGSDNVTFDVGPSEVVLDLSDTTVIAGDYGEPTKLVVLSIDAKGRVIAASEVALESGNVTETSNLFFTTARARSSISGGSHISYSSGTGVIAFNGTGVTGTFLAPTSFTLSDGLITAIS